MTIFSQFVRVLTVFRQDTSIPYASQPFSQINNELPHEKKKKNYVGGKIFPYINYGKGDT
eukprot:1145380-Pelagomonas_calceolata.AAC.3